MSSIALKPLLTPRAVSKDPINPNEFWPAFPSLAQKTEELFGSLEARNKIPIFPLGDLSDKLRLRKCCCQIKANIRTLARPIEIYFLTNDKGASGITIAYRIKSIQKPKYPCLRTKVQRAIEMIDMVSPENPTNSKTLGRVITKFGPASASDSLFLPLLHKLFAEGGYDENRSTFSGCFSLYKSARISLDK